MLVQQGRACTFEFKRNAEATGASAISSWPIACRAKRGSPWLDDDEPSDEDEDRRSIPCVMVSHEHGRYSFVEAARTSR